MTVPATSTLSSLPPFPPPSSLPPYHLPCYSSGSWAWWKTSAEPLSEAPLHRGQETRTCGWGHEGGTEGGGGGGRRGGGGVTYVFGPFSSSSVTIDSFFTSSASTLLPPFPHLLLILQSPGELCRQVLVFVAFPPLHEYHQACRCCSCCLPRS